MPLPTATKRAPRKPKCALCFGSPLHHGPCEMLPYSEYRRAIAGNETRPLEIPLAA